MISILVCSRVSNNKNWALPHFLESLKEKSADCNNFEVLVKFDTDDKRVPKVLPLLGSYPFPVKHIIEPRGRGYLDLHIFYNRLLTRVDEKSTVVMAAGDDFKILQPKWDELVLSKAKVFPDEIFVMHGRPHPPYTRDNYQEQKLHLDFDINALEDLYIIDEAPLWSKKLLDICGGFGHLSFTDAWTLALEYYLYHRCGINRTIFFDQPIAGRTVTDEVDQRLALRWWTDRAENFAFARGSFYKTMVESQAVNIFTFIKMAEMSRLPPPFKDESKYQPRTITPDELGRLRRQARVTRVKTKALNLFPSFMHPALKKIYRTIGGA
ncbi:MAG: hypothetical protein Q7R57_00615 [Dehalococcoidales bacterium]|nr:hypothetical protein [Dehalococcoidales bacterium]